MERPHRHNPEDGGTLHKARHAGQLRPEEGRELPTREFDTPFDKAVEEGKLSIQAHEVHDTSRLPQELHRLPNVPAQTQETTTKPGRGKKALAAILAATTIGGVGYGIGKVAGGKGGQPRGQETSQSATQHPAPKYDTAPDGKPWSVERADMIQIYSMQDNLVDPAYFNPDGSGKFDTNINKEAVTTTINSLLHNRSVAIARGTKDSLLATFGKGPADTSSGEWGSVQSQVDLVNSEHADDVKNVANNPNFPMMEAVVTKINIVQPVTAEIIGVTAEVETREYVADSNNEVVEFRKRQRIDIGLNYKTVKGWSDGNERTMWVITDWVERKLLGVPDSSSAVTPSGPVATQSASASKSN